MGQAVAPLERGVREPLVGCKGGREVVGTITRSPVWLLLALSGIACQAGAPEIVQRSYLKASNANRGDGFGGSSNGVMLFGDTLVVGAPGESSAATAIDGDQSDDSAKGAGAAYVFVRAGSSWAQQAYLKASNAASGDRFGTAVSLFEDTLAVAASGKEYGAGAVYVFGRVGAGWSEQAVLTASNADEDDHFGASVAITGDTLVVGAPGEASSGSGPDANQNDNSTDSAGAVYVFVRAGDGWVQQAYLKGSDARAHARFGVDVAVSGRTLAVASSEGISVFVGKGTSWSEQSFGNLDAGNYGARVELVGDTLVTLGAQGVHTLARSSVGWTQEAVIAGPPEDPMFGSDWFGYSLALSDRWLVVGAPGDDSPATGVDVDEADNYNTENSGAAYLYERLGGRWVRIAYLKASNTNLQGRFGDSVALWGQTVVVGAAGEDSGATGVDGDQANHTAPGAGAVYVFE